MVVLFRGRRQRGATETGRREPPAAPRRPGRIGPECCGWSGRSAGGGRGGSRRRSASRVPQHCCVKSELRRCRADKRAARGKTGARCESVCPALQIPSAPEPRSDLKKGSNCSFCLWLFSFEQVYRQENDPAVRTTAVRCTAGSHEGTEMLRSAPCCPGEEGRRTGNVNSGRSRHAEREGSHPDRCALLSAFRNVSARGLEARGGPGVLRSKPENPSGGAAGAGARTVPIPRRTARVRNGSD